MAHVIIYSIPFGSGPTAKAIVIADYLSDFHQVTLSSYIHGVELISNSAPNTGLIDTGSRNLTRLHTILEQGLDTFISVMDLGIIAELRQCYPQIRTIFVDSLLSWRLATYADGDIESAEAVDLWIAQYVPGLSRQGLEARLGRNATKVRIVRPLLKPPPSTVPSVGSGIVVHFGGMASPVIDCSRYSAFVDRTVALLIRRFGSTGSVTFTGAGPVMAMLKEHSYTRPNVRFLCLPYDAFQATVAGTSLVLTTPGIETTYEAIAFHRPVAFLPPINSTQLHQLEFLRLAGFPDTIPTSMWPEFERISNLDTTYPEKTAKLCDLVNRLSTSDSYEEALNTTVERVLSTQGSVCATQASFLPPDLEDGLEIIGRFVANLDATRQDPGTSGCGEGGRAR